MIKKAIEAELKRRQWTAYRLWKEVEGEMPQSTVYAFLAGNRDLTTHRADILLRALGLTVRRRTGVRR